MCMGIPISEADKEKLLKAARKRGYIRVWKVARLEPDRFRAPLRCCTYKAGVRQSDSVGYHGFLSRKAARSYAISGGLIHEVVLQCLAKPEWLKTAGATQAEGPTATFTKLMFPEYPDRRVTVAEFRAAIKE